MSLPLQDDDVGTLERRVAALEAAGRYAEAIAPAERHVEVAKARFGEDHPSYAAALTALAALLRRAGRLEEAEALLRRAIAVYQKHADGHQLQLANAFGSLAQLLSETGRAAEAEALRPYAVGAPPPSVADASPAEPDAESVDAAVAAGSDDQPAGHPAPQPPAPAQRAGGNRYELGSLASGAEPAPQTAARRRAEPQPRPPSALPERTDLPKPRQRVDAKRTLEIDAGRLAYQIPGRMWVGMQETVEVRLGRAEAQGLTENFGGRGEVRAEDIPIVETMSVTLTCEPGTFDIVARSEKDQLVKPDLVLGTPFHGSDFARWVWLVTPLQSGEHTLLVKVSAAVRDSRGLPTTAALPDKTFAVTVRVRLVRTAVAALARAAPGLAWAVITALVGVFTKDYWWPAIRDMLGLG